MKIKVCLFLVLSTFSSLAQEVLHVSTPTFAYSDKSMTQKVGVFLRGAQLTNFEKFKHSYQVNLDYSDPIYIKDIQNLKKSLRATDSFESSPSPIIDNDQYSASPHLFTTVASLKLREYPDTEAMVKGVVLNGTVVPIDYFPLTKEGWVQLSTADQTGYISIQFLGERPIMADLIKAYHQASELADKKRYAERILELGWNSDTKENIKALEFFGSYAKENKLTELAELSQLQAKALKAAPKKGNYTKAYSLIDKEQFGFTLNGVVEPIDGFSKESIEQYVGYPIESYADLEDCTLQDYEGVDFYNSAEFITHDIHQNFKVREFEMLNFNGFKIGTTQLDQNTTEKAFLEITVGLLSTINPTSKSYIILIDSAYYKFSFRNDKLVKVELIYYC